MNLDQIYKAWLAVGADVAGLNWSDFAKAIDTPQANQQPIAWIWTHKINKKQGAYFEDPATFFDMTKPSDYDWTPVYAKQTSLPDVLTQEYGDSAQYVEGWNECREVMRGMMK